MRTGSIYTKSNNNQANSAPKNPRRQRTNQTQDIYNTGFQNQSHASLVTLNCKQSLEHQMNAAHALKLANKDYKFVFATPSLPAASIRHKKSKALSISTKDTNPSPKGSKSQESRFPSSDPQRQILAAIASQDKKLASLVQKLTQFEEECVIDGVLDSQNLGRFRAISRGYLGLIVQNYDSLRSQRTRSLVISLIFAACSAIGVSNQQFLFEVSKVVKKTNVIKISSLKKLKSYIFLKSATKDQSSQQAN